MYAVLDDLRITYIMLCRFGAWNEDKKASCGSKSQHSSGTAFVWVYIKREFEEQTLNCNKSLVMLCFLS